MCVWVHCGGGWERWRMDGAVMKGSVSIRRRNTHWVLRSHYTPEQTHLLTFLQLLPPSLFLCSSFLPRFLRGPTDNSSPPTPLFTTSFSHTTSLFKSGNTTHAHTHYSNYRATFVISSMKVLYCIFKLFVIMTAAFTKKKEARVVLDEERSVVLFFFFTYLSLSSRSLRRSELVSICLGKHGVTVKDLQSWDARGVESLSLLFSAFCLAETVSVVAGEIVGTGVSLCFTGQC